MTPFSRLAPPWSQGDDILATPNTPRQRDRDAVAMLRDLMQGGAQLPGVMPTPIDPREPSFPGLWQRLDATRTGYQAT